MLRPASTLEGQAWPTRSCSIDSASLALPRRHSWCNRADLNRRGETSRGWTISQPASVDIPLALAGPRSCGRCALGSGDKAWSGLDLDVAQVHVVTRIPVRRSVDSGTALAILAVHRSLRVRRTFVAHLSQRDERVFRCQARYPSNIGRSSPTSGPSAIVTGWVLSAPLRQRAGVPVPRRIAVRAHLPNPRERS